jgi:hypothetical protein
MSQFCVYMKPCHDCLNGDLAPHYDKQFCENCVRTVEEREEAPEMNWCPTRAEYTEDEPILPEGG